MWTFVLLAVGLTLSGAVAAAVPDTGQTACFDTGRGERACPPPGAALFGQDGNYATNPPRPRDNGDGTVSDPVTGLMWQKGFTRDVQWKDAESLARRATTGGHADWRVPTIKELYSLIDFSGATGTARSFASAPPDARPFLDTRVFAFEYPTATGARFIDAQYISSTAYTGLTMGRARTFFGVNFADGRIKGYPQEAAHRPIGWYLRLVRGPAGYGRNVFQDDGNGGVSDRATGLTWTKSDSGDPALRPKLGRTRLGDGRMDWREALAFCESLSHAGADDWRLPNAKELQSLVDYGRSPQATGSAAIDPLFQATPITDEAGRPNWPAYWTSTTHLDGPSAGADAVVIHFGEALGTLGGGGPGMGGGMGPPGMGRPPGMGGPPPGGPMMGGPMMGGGGRAAPASSIIDVHGAGAQRSDPKTGDPSAYPQWGRGPQGDVRRVFNHVRCVRTG
ncbi:MAG: DUF1566 domain-containing protein [Alphaproteobacteria bacterium]|nr:DUF1566 domain-containing protein [Alphaproteobacteria bacterium]